MLFITGPSNTWHGPDGEKMFVKLDSNMLFSSVTLNASISVFTLGSV